MGGLAETPNMDVLKLSVSRRRDAISGKQLLRMLLTAAQENPLQSEAKKKNIWRRRDDKKKPSSNFGHPGISSDPGQMQWSLDEKVETWTPKLWFGVGETTIRQKSYHFA